MKNMENKSKWSSPIVQEFEVDKDIIRILLSGDDTGGKFNSIKLGTSTMSSQEEETDANPFSYNPFATE